jgi:hypothetical protein
LPGDKRFELRGLSPPHGVHLGYFDEPLSAKMLDHILSGGNIGQAIRKPIAADYAAG